MHIAFVPLTGSRVVSPVVRELGVRLPDLRRRGEALSHLPALGLLTLAGMLPRDVSSSWHPTTSIDDAFISLLVKERPSLVAVSATTATADEAYKLATSLREENIPCILGGLHATTCPDEASGVFDAVVVGDGESVWLDVVDDARRGALKPVYQKRWAPEAHDWPTPRFDLHRGRPSRWTLQTERGCPFACEFCGASRMLGAYREKPIAVIRAELEALRSLDTTPLIELADDNTFAVRNDASALLEVFAESGARWFTEVDWRMGERPDVLRRLSQAGCVQVLVGLESQVFRYPGMGAKQTELDRMMRAVYAIQDAGIVVHGCFIVGADGETRASMDRLRNFVLGSQLADVQITLQTPFPGTALRRRLDSQRRLLGHRGWSHHTLFDVTYEPDGMSVRDLEDGFHDVLKCVHAPDAVARRSRLRRSIWRGHRHMHARHTGGIQT